MRENIAHKFTNALSWDFFAYWTPHAPAKLRLS